MHEESSQVRVPAFANPEQLLLASSCQLLGRQLFFPLTPLFPKQTIPEPHRRVTFQTQRTPVEARPAAPSPRVFPTTTDSLRRKFHAFRENCGASSNSC